MVTDGVDDKSNEKPCPFCGKPGVYRAYREDGSRGDWCPNCQRSIPKMEPPEIIEESPDKKVCPFCGKQVVIEAYVEDGGMGDWCPLCKKSLPRIREKAPSDSAAEETRSLSGFWRRPMAFGIDCLLLFLLAFLPAKVIFHAWGYLGVWECLLGFATAWLYFGWWNSSWGGGQTPGKGIMKIEVVDQAGNHIPPGRSFLRFAILGAPWFLSRVPIPFSMMMTPLGYAIGFLLSGLGGAIVYLYIFNRRTRQSLHDLAAGTFVVKTLPKGPVPAVPIWKPHLAGVGVLFLAIFGAQLFLLHLFPKGAFPGMVQVAKKIESSGKIRVRSIMDISTRKITGKVEPKTNWVRIIVILKQKPDSWKSLAATAREIVTPVIGDYPGIMKRDLLALDMEYGYDYVIAWSRQTYNLAYRPSQWQKLLANPKKIEDALTYSPKGLKGMISRYSSDLRRNPQDPQAYYNRGLAYYWEGDFDHAIADLTRALKLNPKNARVYYDRGLIYYRQEDWDRSIADASRALELKPDAKAYLLRGNAYFQEQDFDQALTDYNRALKCSPRYDDAYFARGLTYSRKGDWDQALKDWNRALELNPKHANAYYDKAEFLESAGKKKEAIEAYQGYVRYAPPEARDYVKQAQERIKILQE
jgi:tetratricopeptide (TPR) repeat protein/uncharacterized RDD family membrane protein YckC